MLETIIDSEIFIDFCKSRPAPVPEGTKQENNEWLSFWSFLQSDSDLKFIGYSDFNAQKAESRFLSALTSGRGDAKINFVPKFNWPKNGKLPKNPYPGSFFCLNLDVEEKRVQLTTQNGLLFAFMNNYKEQWQKLSNSDTFHIRRGLKEGKLLVNWESLSPFILPFTDVIICDKFIHQKDYRDKNLLEIIKLLDKHASKPYNLLIITNKDNIHLDEFESYLKEKIAENKLKANLGIVLSRKEHDRCIIMNYMRIDSGDSFNYFNSAGTINTNGTELKLFPHCYPKNFNDTRIRLDAIQNIVKNERDDSRGNITNHLFEYCNTQTLSPLREVICIFK
jgi:hypothetical protein